MKHTYTQAHACTQYYNNNIAHVHLVHTEKLYTCMYDNKNVYFIHNVDRATNIEEITTGIENTDKGINTTENEGSAVNLHLVHIHPSGCPGFFSSSWLTNVDGMKDLWCSSTVRLLSTQI